MTSTVHLPDGVVDLVRGQVVRRGRVTARLTARDLELVSYLAAHGGLDVTRDQLGEDVLGCGDRATRAVDSAIFRLRSKLEADPAQPVTLITVQGVGYRWVPSPPPPGPVELPAPREELVGVDERFAELDDAVAHLGAAAVVGPPGIGKTTLAVAWARSRSPRFPGGVQLVECGTAVELAVARALGVPVDDPRSAEAIGWALAARGDAVLVLDDADLDAVGAVWAAWRRAAPRLRWVVTSRVRPSDPLQVGVVEVGPMPVDRAATLFVARARAARADYAPTDDDRSAIRELVTALDGVPLAIELAASRIGALSAGAMVERLPAGMRLLEPAGRGQVGLRGAFEASWHALAPADRASLARASAFAGRFGPGAARAVLGPDAEAALDRLVRRSLVTVDAGGDGAPWFRLLSSLRAFAAERLAEDRAAQDEAYARHAAWATRDAATLPRRVLGPGGRAVARRLTEERQDVRLVVERFHERDPRLAGWAVLAGSSGLLRGAGDPTFDARVLALDDRLHADDPATLRFEVHRVAAYIDRRHGRFAACVQRLDRADEVARTLGAYERVRIAADRAGLRTVMGDPADGVRLGTEAREAAEALGDDGLLGVVLADLGVALKQVGELDEAGLCYERALVLLERSEADLLLGLVLSNVGVLDAERGRAGLARERFSLAAARHERVGNLLSAGLAQLNLALLDDEEGDLPSALEGYHRAIDVLRRTGIRRYAGLASANLGGALGRAGRPVAARRCLREAKQIAMDLDLPRDVAVAEGELGLVAWIEGRRAEARSCLTAAAACPAGPRYEALYQGCLGALWALDGDPGRSAAALERAEQASARAQDPAVPPFLARMQAIAAVAAGGAPGPLPPGRGWWVRYGDQRLREALRAAR